MTYKNFFSQKNTNQSRDNICENKRLVMDLSEISLNDTALVGSKNASLGEMFNSLSAKGIRVPSGFAVTTEAFQCFLEYNDLIPRIKRVLNSIDQSNLLAVVKSSRKVQSWIVAAEVPPQLITAITQRYNRLESEYGKGTYVAVRGSPAAREYPVSEVTSQNDSLLNIQGIDLLLRSVLQVFSALYTDTAILHRINLGLDAFCARTSVGIQKMVRADLSSSGVMCTLDPETGFRDVVYIASAYGLGTGIVSGTLNPDEFFVFKPMLKNGWSPIIKRQLGDKAIRHTHSSNDLRVRGIRTVPVPKRARCQFSLSDEDVLELAYFAREIEDHYSQLVGRPMPMDIEWAKDGDTGDLFVTQARPEIVQSRKPLVSSDVYLLEEPGWVLCRGFPVGNEIVSGKARVIRDPANMNRLREGEILVTDFTDERWTPVLQRAAAIVTYRGGRAGHSAKVARELNISAVVGAGDAISSLKDGMNITVCCTGREEGRVYEGNLRSSHYGVNFSVKEPPKTPMMLSIANPSRAFEHSLLPVAGVGLVQLEFIILHNVGIHPRAFLQVARVDTELQHEISAACAGFKNPREYYLARLMEGIGTVAASFYPRPVTVRFSDFKSDEYRAMRAGEYFETNEENPLVGLRGASRFLSDDFRETFQLECEAVSRVRNEMGLMNTRIMVPFVRSLDESAEILALMKDYGLERGQAGLEVFMMCETPANALMADEFLEDYDGLMVGMDDLSQLTIGFDGSARQLPSYDEKNLAVLRLILLAIEACKRQGKHIGVVGKDPSAREDVTSWLVAQGVDSITFESSCYSNMLEIVQRAEERLQSKDI